jgi:hypothetical protein
MEQKRLMLSKQVAIESVDEDGVIVFHTDTCHRMKLTKPLYELLRRFKDPMSLKDVIPARADGRLIECFSELIEKGFLVEEGGVAAAEKKLAAPTDTLFRCPRHRPDNYVTGRPIGWLDVERREGILEDITISDWGDMARTRKPFSIALPILIGGDHSVTFPAVERLQSQHQLAVIWFDAHTDFSDIIPGAHINHANVARRIADLPNVSKLVHVGYRWRWRCAPRRHRLRTKSSAGGNAVLPLDRHRCARSDIRPWD